MSDPVDDPPPVDVQAEPSERARADANKDAGWGANLEAAILRDLPRLISPINRRAENPPVLPFRVNGRGPAQGQAQGGGQAHQPGLLQQLPGSREKN